MSYSSLSVCSRCPDLTSELTKACARELGLDPGNFTGCSVSLPNEFNLGGAENYHMNIMVMSTRSCPVYYCWKYLFCHSREACQCLRVRPCALCPQVSQRYCNQRTHPSANGYNGIAFMEYADKIWDDYQFNHSSFPWNGSNIDIPLNSTRHDPTHPK